MDRLPGLMSKRVALGGALLVVSALISTVPALGFSSAGSATGSAPVLRIRNLGPLGGASAPVAVSGPQPPGVVPAVRFAVGDVLGEGRDALVLLAPMPDSPRYAVTVYRPSAGRLDRAAAWPEIDLLVIGLALADVTGGGRQEIWLGHAPQVGCLEWDGTNLAPLQPWKFWQNKPVAVGSLSEPGTPDKVLALGSYYSADVGIGLIATWWRDKMWGKAFDIRGSEFFDPGDRFAAADVNGDGALELLMAANRFRRALAVVPFSITGLRDGRIVAAFEGLFPDALGVTDLDGSGVPEIYLACNLAAGEGRPATGRLSAYQWDGRSFAEVLAAEYPGRLIADLAAGDLDGDGQANLYVGFLSRREDGYALEIEVFGATGEVKL